MSTSISSIGSSITTMMQGMQASKRPNPSELASNLFSKLDTSGQGYLQKSDLQAAFNKVSSTSSGSSSSSTSVDDLFSKLDVDSDGKVTKQEFSDSIKNLADQLDNQFMDMRKQDAMQGSNGMPPPPPGGTDDAGFTKDELTSQLKEIGSSDSKRSSLISNIVDNFDKADTDSNGKVSLKEAMTFDKANSTSSSASSASDTGTTTTSTASADDLTKIMQQIMQLMQAYNLNGETGNANFASLSVLA